MAGDRWPGSSKIHDVVLISMFSATNSMLLARMPLRSRGDVSNLDLHPALLIIQESTPNKVVSTLLKTLPAGRCAGLPQLSRNVYVGTRCQPHFRKPRLT